MAAAFSFAVTNLPFGVRAFFTARLPLVVLATAISSAGDSPLGAARRLPCSVSADSDGVGIWAPNDAGGSSSGGGPTMVRVLEPGVLSNGIARSAALVRRLGRETGEQLLGTIEEGAEIAVREAVDHLYIALPPEQHVQMLAQADHRHHRSAEGLREQLRLHAGGVEVAAQGRVTGEQLVGFVRDRLRVAARHHEEGATRPDNHVIDVPLRARHPHRGPRAHRQPEGGRRRPHRQHARRAHAVRRSVDRRRFRHLDQPRRGLGPGRVPRGCARARH